MSKFFITNSTLIETNILNITVVVIFLFFFLGDILKESLSNRKKKIITDFRKLNQRTFQLKKSLNCSLRDLEKARKKIQNIKSQNLILIQKEQNIFNKKVSNDLKLLHISYINIYILEKTKIHKQLFKKLIEISLNKVNMNLYLHLNDYNHHRLNNLQILNFRYYDQN